MNGFLFQLNNSLFTKTRPVRSKAFCATFSPSGFKSVHTMEREFLANFPFVLLSCVYFGDNCAVSIE